MSCSGCPHAARCASCSRWRALRNAHQCKMIAHYHLYYHDVLTRTGTVEHRKDARLNSGGYRVCLTLEEIWNAEYRPDAG